MKLYIPQYSDSYGDSSDEQIEKAQELLKAKAAELGIEWEPMPEVYEQLGTGELEDAHPDSEKIFEEILYQL